MNIDELKAGPELDALVAEKVMGWSRASAPAYRHPKMCWINPNLRAHGPVNLPPYSTDIAAAWQVLEKLKTQFTYIDVSSGPNEWLCMVHILEDENPHLIAEAREAPTAPLAICRAAFKAVEEEPKT